jgi:ubiquinone/menaquinone biosynthesis C-methylase UbiE
MISDQSAQYYAKSASNHDRVYDKPERQQDLQAVRERVADLLDGERVLELACGTGYWTNVIIEAAAHVVATDINPEMLAMAQLRNLPAEYVQWRLADGWHLPQGLGQFTAVFIGFWWSHIKREEQDRFLAQLRERVGKDVLLVIADDSYVDEESPTIARTDLQGNTHHIFTTVDGERYEVTKNYPTDSFLRKKPGAALREVKIKRYDYYFVLSGRLK